MEPSILRLQISLHHVGFGKPGPSWVVTYSGVGSGSLFYGEFPDKRDLLARLAQYVKQDLRVRTWQVLTQP